MGWEYAIAFSADECLTFTTSWHARSGPGVRARGQKELATQKVMMTLTLTPNFIFFNILHVIMIAPVKVSYYYLISLNLRF